MSAPHLLLELASQQTSGQLIVRTSIVIGTLPVQPARAGERGRGPGAPPAVPKAPPAPLSGAAPPAVAEAAVVPVPALPTAPPGLPDDVEALLVAPAPAPAVLAPLPDGAAAAGAAALAPVFLPAAAVGAGAAAAGGAGFFLSRPICASAAVLERAREGKNSNAGAHTTHSPSCPIFAGFDSIVIVYISFDRIGDG